MKLRLAAALRARADRLTNEWQTLSRLKLDPHEGATYFDELRVLGIAEERRTPLQRNGIAVGETIEFRLAKRDMSQ